MIGRDAAVAALFLLTTLPTAAEQVDERANGGFPESFFMEKLPQAEAKATAEKLANPKTPHHY